MNHDYEITLDETVTESDFSVTGSIDVTNTHPNDAMTVSLADVLDDATVATIGSCVGGTLTGASLEVPANSTAVCEYTATPGDRTATLNTATATTANGVEVSGTADVAWTKEVVGYDAVNVTDDYATPGDLLDDLSWGPIPSDQTLAYDRDFTCSSDLGDYTDGYYHATFINTAVIDETGAYDDATVTLNCYALSVSKTANTTYTRTYDWIIDKDAVDADGVTIPVEGLMLAQGQAYNLEWRVTADLAAIPYVDSDHKVEGVITVSNPSTDAATVDVSDVFTPDGEPGVPIAVDCDPIAGGDQATGIIVPAEGSVDCTYEHMTAGAQDGDNVATATLVSPTAATEFSGNTPVAFGDPSTLVNDEVIVTDTFNGGAETAIGTVTVAEAPKTFTVFTLLSSDPADLPDALLFCGANLVVNDAAVYVDDNGNLGALFDTATREVPVFVACEDGCTLTLGYWKTHNLLFWGGAPDDDAWFLIGDADGDGTLEGSGEDFYNSGQTWFEVLWTAPQGGNAYYQLAHQWIAATLNTLNEAGTTADVDEALAWGETVLLQSIQALLTATSRARTERISVPTARLGGIQRRRYWPGTL